MDFLNRKVSTLAGIIILLAITSAIGYFIVYQFKEITDIRMRTIERNL